MPVRFTILNKKPDVSQPTFMQKLWLLPWFWLLVDAALINVAFGLAYYVRYTLQFLRAVDPANNVPYTAFLPFVVLLTAVLIFAYWQKDLYRIKRRLSVMDELTIILDGTTTGIVLIIVLVFVYRPTFYSRAIFLYAGIIVVALVGGAHGLKIAVLSFWRKHGFGVARLLIVGAGEIARTIMRTVVANPQLGYEIVGFVDDDVAKGATDIGRFKALGSTGNLAKLLHKEKVDEVIITLPWQYHRKITSITGISERANIRARIVPDMFQITLSHMDVTQMMGIPLIGVKPGTISRGGLLVKRMVDVTVAAVGLVILAPLLGLIALAIKLESDGSAIFSQERVGRYGRRLDRKSVV